MSPSYSFSLNNKRNLAYKHLLHALELPGATINLQQMVEFGSQLMRKAKLHPHFFMDNTLEKNAQYLACFALKLPFEEFNGLLPLNKQQVLAIIKLYEQRIHERIPVEYITNEAIYLGRKFYVNQHVLVPRSLMSARFNDFLNTAVWKNYKVLDLCAGSGCIGITLALLHPQIKVDLVDLSLDALEVALTNVNLHGLKERVTCIQSDLFTNINHKYDLIITNPPYVASKDYHKAPTEFKHEPKMALESGKTGLDLIHKILMQAQQYLNPQGKIIAEVGYPAAKLIKKKYPHFNLQWLSYKPVEIKNSWFTKWLAPILAMDCIFVLEN